jgi:TPR repeat protein
MISKSEKSKYERALKLAQAQSEPSREVYDLLLAADKEGDVSASYALATWYIHGSSFAPINLKRAVQLLKKAAKGNVSGAAFDLAFAYEQGAGVEKNLELAFESYVHAALLGDAQAFFEVGRMYHWGYGVKKNFRMAKYWYLKAESLGVSD